MFIRREGPASDKPEIVAFVLSKQALIDEQAKKHKISSRDLTVLTLLYLPRIMHDDYPSDDALRTEVERLCALIIQKAAHHKDWQDPPQASLDSPSDAVFCCITQEEARIVHENFHYIGSFRPDGMHFALKTRFEQKIVAVASIAPYDLSHITPILPEQLESGNVLVVSRVYSFDWAPRNTTSYILSRVQKHISQQSKQIAMLLTYVNPNLGFSGASFRAANWKFFGREDDTRYCYLDGRYITDRVLEKTYGTSDATMLAQKLGARFEASTISLAPLHLYSIFLDKMLLHKYADGFDFLVHRP
jgi:hypothetical protein